MAMPLPKQGGKMVPKSMEELKKKKSVMSKIFLQYFHNKSHVINYYQFKKNFVTN